MGLGVLGVECCQKRLAVECFDGRVGELRSCGFLEVGVSLHRRRNRGGKPRTPLRKEKESSKGKSYSSSVPLRHTHANDGDTRVLRVANGCKGENKQK